MSKRELNLDTMNEMLQDTLSALPELAPILLLLVKLTVDVFTGKIDKNGFLNGITELSDMILEAREDDPEGSSEDN